MLPQSVRKLTKSIIVEWRDVKWMLSTRLNALSSIGLITIIKRCAIIKSIAIIESKYYRQNYGILNCNIIKPLIVYAWCKFEVSASHEYGASTVGFVIVIYVF